MEVRLSGVVNREGWKVNPGLEGATGRKKTQRQWERTSAHPLVGKGSTEPAVARRIIRIVRGLRSSHAHALRALRVLSHALRLARGYEAVLRRHSDRGVDSAQCDDR